MRLALETAYNDNDAGSIIFVNLIVIGLGAVILGVGIKGVKARNEPCHCCCCATWLDAYKILTIVQMVFCSFDLILSVAAVAFGGQVRPDAHGQGRHWETESSGEQRRAAEENRRTHTPLRPPQRGEVSGCGVPWRVHTPSRAPHPWVAAGTQP